MIKINYGTSQYFEENVGDKYYCKSFASVKRKLKEVMGEDKTLDGLKGFKEDIIKQYDNWIFDKKTTWSVGSLNISVGDLHISVKEIDLV